jgi:uncharacterized membrane protein
MRRRPVSPERAAASAAPRQAGGRWRWRQDGPVALAIALSVAFHNYILLSHFHGYVFAFHDLGIISDWFSNALYHGRPFWITDMAVSHLTIHFTPTIFLLTPLFRLTQSQYLLVLLGTLAIGAALFIGHRILVRLLAPLGAPADWVTALSALLVLCVSLNPYVKTLEGSAHIEIFYVPFALGFFYMLLFSERRIAPWVLFALALGVREDGGIYLAMQSLALLFVPPAVVLDPPRLRRRAAAAAPIALAYVVAIVKLVNPYVFGVYENHVHRGWGRWGDSWTEVVLQMATSPLQLAHAIGDSAFLHLNASFLFLPWLHPLYGLLINVPGTLLFAAEPLDKRMLWFYNAAFLLPGFLLGLYVGVYRLARLAPAGLRLAPGDRDRAARATLLLGALAVLGVEWRQRASTVEGPGAYGFRARESAERDQRAIAAVLADCPAGTRVATDFRRIVYLPNRMDRYLLRNAGKADVVLLFRGADPMLSGRATAGETWSLLEQDRSFALRCETAEERIYARPGVRCLRLP